VDTVKKFLFIAVAAAVGVVVIAPLVGTLMSKVGIKSA
jgi:hypothetical protein